MRLGGIAVTKKCRVQLCIEAAACMLFSLLLLKMIFAEDYLLYVTPRMKPWLIFTALIMLFWTFSALKSLSETNYTLAPTSVFGLLIPFVLLLLPANQIDITKLSFTGSSAFSSRTAGQPNTASANPFLTPQTEVSEDGAALIDGSGIYNQTEKTYTKLKGYDAENRTITVGDDDFLAWVDAVYKNPADFENWNIQITGTVFYDERFMKEDEFVPARLLMVCCAADLVPYGLICRYEKANELENGAWFSVKGRIALGEYHGNPEPQVVVESLVQAAAINKYIYPRF